MVQCKRLGYAVLTTSNLESQIDYYSNIIGLSLSYQDKFRAVLSTQHGLETIVLEAGEKAELTGLSFEISPRHDLADIQRDLSKAGVASEIRTGRTPNIDRVLAFRDPKGTEIELSNAIGFAPISADDRGVSPLKLGHIAYSVPSIAKPIEFYETILGFRRSDWRDGLAMFMRCNSDHHTVNFFQGEQKLHHLAFEVKDFAELVRASDYLTRKKHTLLWGPARHTIGHNCACYHVNSDGLLIELYAEMDQMKDEELGYFEPRPWHEDRPQRPRGWDACNSPINKWIPSAPPPGHRNSNG